MKAKFIRQRVEIILIPGIFWLSGCGTKIYHPWYLGFLPENKVARIRTGHDTVPPCVRPIAKIDGFMVYTPLEISLGLTKETEYDICIKPGRHKVRGIGSVHLMPRVPTVWKKTYQMYDEVLLKKAEVNNHAGFRKKFKCSDGSVVTVKSVENQLIYESEFPLTVIKEDPSFWRYTSRGYDYAVIEVEAGRKYYLWPNTVPFVAMVPTHKIAIVKKDGKIILHEARLYPPKSRHQESEVKQYVEKPSSLHTPEFVYPLKDGCLNTRYHSFLNKHNFCWAQLLDCFLSLSYHKGSNRKTGCFENQLLMVATLLLGVY